METQFKLGDSVITKSLRRIWLWGRLWPVVNRHIAIVVAVEPQGILLDDGMYYPESELKKGPDKNFDYWLNRIDAISSVPLEVREVTKACVRLFDEYGRLPTFINSREEDTMVIEYCGYPQYTLEIWAYGYVVILLTNAEARKVYAYDTTTFEVVPKLKELLAIPA